MVAQSFRLLSPRLGLEIATMYCFKAAEGILASIASMRVVASNREFGQPTLRTAQHKPASIAEQIELERTTSAKGPTADIEC
jgi:hypothetical protein